MKSEKNLSMAKLCNEKIKGKNLSIVLSLIVTLFVFNSCKKDLLLPVNRQTSTISNKIKSISYLEFINSINLEKTGVLKTSLSNAGKDGNGKLMSSNIGSNGLEFDTDSVKKLTLGDTVSYVISLKPETPHAVQFRNLTIQILNNKTTAFLTTYLPTQEFVKAYKLNKKTSFKGEIFVNKISLEELPQISGLSTVKNNSNGKLMSLNANGVLLNNNKISLAPGECEEYDVYESVRMSCKFGHYSKSDCTYQQEYDTWEILPNINDWPPYDAFIYVGTALNCAPPASGGGSGNGGGVTTPNPLGGYDPCECETPTVSAVGENKGGLKLAVGAPNCCDEGGLPPVVIEDPIDEDFHERSDMVWDDDTERYYSYGELEDYYAANPSAMDYLYEGNDFESVSPIAPWMITLNQRIALEAQNLHIIHPNWSKLRLSATATWNVMGGTVHFVLQTVGLVPVFGEAADILDGAIYFLEGDYFNAATSAASAVPVYGWFATGGKWVRTASKTLTRPLSDAVGKVAFRAVKSVKGEVRFIKVALNSFSHSAISALKAVKPADNTLTNLSRSLLDQASHRIKPTLQSLKDKIDDVKFNGDANGSKTESI